MVKSFSLNFGSVILMSVGVQKFKNFTRIVYTP